MSFHGGCDLLAAEPSLAWSVRAVVEGVPAFELFAVIVVNALAGDAGGPGGDPEQGPLNGEVRR